MIKQYFSSSDERRLKDQSHTMFREVSSGVYYVEKDRYGDYPRFVTSGDVTDALNNRRKTSVTSSIGIYANFELVK